MLSLDNVTDRQKFYLFIFIDRFSMFVSNSAAADNSKVQLFQFASSPKKFAIRAAALLISSLLVLGTSEEKEPDLLPALSVENPRACTPGC
jgi:hypothetical protein